MNRRKFLILSGTGLALFGSGILIIRRPGSDKTSKAVTPLSKGPLSSGASVNLLAVAQAITGRRDLHGNYAEFFQWRAKNFEGYRELYEKYSSELEKKSLKLTNQTFVNNSLESRFRIIENFRPELRELVKKIRAKAANDESLAFEEKILQEILHLFARSDAFLALGYDFFPGQARGFEMYRSLPRHGIISH